MSTILSHMMWPQCEFRMHVKYAARGSFKMQDAKNRPKNHHLRSIQ